MSLCRPVPYPTIGVTLTLSPLLDPKRIKRYRWMDGWMDNPTWPLALKESNFLDGRILTVLLVRAMPETQGWMDVSQFV